MKRLSVLLGKENSVRTASVILMVTLTLSNVLGLLRDRFLANNLSFSDLSIYFAAFRIPDTLFNFLVLGAITSAFIPIFSEFITQKKSQEGLRVANSLLNAAALIMIAVAILFYFLMPLAMKVVVPGFTEKQFNEAGQLSRLLMLTPVFFSISYIISGILNSSKRFLACALAPLFYNLSIIVGAVYAAPRWGLAGVVYFVIIGSILHVLIQIPALLNVDFKYRAIIDLRDGVVGKVVKLMIPRSLSLGANQLMYTVYTAIGSSLAAQAIAAFNFANNIQTVPVVVLGNSFATAVFPTLAQKIAEGDHEGFSRYLLRTMRAIGFLLIPTTVIFVLLRAQIVRLILGTERVSWEETRMTALALGYFSLSLLAQGLIPLLARAFFALKNTKTPMLISFFSVLFSVIIAYPLSKSLSVSGLALAFTLGSFVQAASLYFALKKIYSEIKDASLLMSYLKITLISLVMGLAAWSAMHLIANFVDMTRYWGVLTQTIFTCLVASAIYLILNYLFSAEELKWVITRRVNGRRISGTVVDQT